MGNGDDELDLAALDEHHPGNVGLVDHYHAVHESGDRDAGGREAARQHHRAGRRAPLNEQFADAIGADAYCRDAAVAVETAKEFLARKHNRRPAETATG